MATYKVSEKMTNIINEMKSLSDKMWNCVGNENVQFPKFSPTQLVIIDYILEHEGTAYQKDLESALNLTRATISSVLGTLEKYDIIKRSIDEVDTRTKKITLTEKSLEFYNSGKDKMNKLEKIALKDISPHDLEIAFNVVKKMNNNLEKEKNKKC